MSTARIVWRDFVSDGIPSSGNHKPEKAEIRRWGTWLENLSASLQIVVSAAFIRGTKAQLDAVDGVMTGQVGIVVADDDVSLRGVYVRQGLSWVKKSDLPADAAQAAADIAEDARDISIDAKNAAEAARDVAAGYVNDIVSEKEVPIYATIEGLAAVNIDPAHTRLYVTGRESVGDGLGGVIIDHSVPEFDITAVVVRSLDGRDWSYARFLPLAMESIAARMAAGETIKVACYGDSTTDGNQTTGWTQNPISGGIPVGGNHNAQAPNTWPVKLQALLRDMFGNNSISVFNAGYASQRMDNGWALNNYEAAVISNPAYGPVDLVFVAFGLNDLRSGVNVVKLHISRTRQLLQKILRYGGTPILLTNDATWRAAFRGDDIDFIRSSRQIDAAKVSLAREFGIECWDIGEAMRDWFACNNDGEQTSVVQSDALHVGDRGHAFKASFIASKIFRDTTVVVGRETKRILPGDPAGAALVGTGSFTFATGIRGQMNALVSSYAQGTRGITAWIWNENPNAVLIYRNLSNGGQSDRANVSMVRVTEFIGNTDLFYDKNDAEGGGQASPYRNTDRPIVVTDLPYGLTRCTLEAPAPGATWYYGYFEVVPDCRAGFVRDRFVRRIRNADALAQSGMIFKQAPASSGNQLYIQDEAQDLSNVISFGRNNKTVSLLIEAQIELGMGIGFLSGRGYEAGVGFQRRIGMAMVRYPTGWSRRYYRINSAGALVVSSDYGSWTDTRTELQRYRIDFKRVGGTGAQAIDVFADWEGVTLLSSQAIASSEECPAAGYFGDVISISDSHGAGGRAVNVKTALVVYE